MKNLQLCLGRGADQDDVGAGNYLAWVGRCFVDSTGEVTSTLPSRFGCVSLDLFTKHLWSSCEDVDLPFRVEVSNDGDGGTGKVTTASESYL